jgi:hypothetical protein
MSEFPALIHVKASSNGTIVYNENLPFRSEPEDWVEVTGFIKLIRPLIKFDYVIFDYIRPLKKTEL